jgi:hypothetical protein
MLVSRERQLNYLLDATHPTFGFTFVLNVGRILCVQSANTFFSRFALLCKNFIGKGKKMASDFSCLVHSDSETKFWAKSKTKKQKCRFPLITSQTALGDMARIGPKMAKRHYVATLHFMPLRHFGSGPRPAPLSVNKAEGITRQHFFKVSQ